MRHAFSKSGDDGEESNEWSDRPFQFQVRCTCHACQHGWMARLEERAKPFLRSMIEGFGRTLYDEGREAVATWAIKTCMSFEGANPNQSIPETHYRHMATHQSPPRNTQVWLGAVDDPTVTTSVAYHWHHGLGVEGHDAYLAAMSVGHLAIVVVGFGTEDPMTRKLDGWPREALIDLWPREEPLRWPPGLIVDIPRLRVLGSVEFAVGDDA
ncbi:MAG: hypothetical protein BGO11_20820 [Solirubrobacterales bacterium 70-9]|nr:MAG: hypothetical protein BGO11_20820 [Solirubrobacterales bacterium 70-9]